MARALRGYSLLETVVAILVLALGVMLLINLFPVSYSRLGWSRRHTTAAFLCQQKLEQVLAAGYASPPPADGAFAQDPGYRYHVEKSAFNSHLKQVLVRVSDTLGPRPALAAEYSTLQGGPLLTDMVAVPCFRTGNTYSELVIVYDAGSGTFKYAARHEGTLLPLVLKEIKLQESPTTPLRMPQQGVPARIRAYATRADDQTTGSYQSPVVLLVYDAKNECIWWQTLGSEGGLLNQNCYAQGEFQKYADLNDSGGGLGP